MVAYNFQRQFASAVRSGAKKNTIRAMRKGRSRHARPGEALQLYSGMRTSACEKLVSDPICSKVQQITISKEEFVRVVLDQELLPASEIEKLAISDGFKNAEKFAAFFEETHGLPFDGVLISWNWGDR